MAWTTHLLVAIGIGLALLGAAVLAQDTVSDPAPMSDSVADAAVVRFHIPTITCATDPLRVEASMRQAPGILNVAFDERDTIITYDPAQVTPAAIVAAIEAGGDLVSPTGA